MANFMVMVPFICHFAAGVFGKNGKELDLPPRDVFELAKLRGWGDDPDDSGGATMVDVTIGTFSRFKGRKVTKQELRNISYEDWLTILKTMFWDRCNADSIRSQGLANLIVDWVWASGPAVLKRLQTVLGVNADGIIGPVTLEAINNAREDELFRKIRDVRERYYRGCRGAWKYLNGWLRRLNAMRPDGSFVIYGKVVKGYV